MDKVRRVRVVEVDADIRHLNAFLVRPENLVRWTAFYKRVGAERRGWHPVETLMGPANTRIRGYGTRHGRRLDIQTRFGERLEAATVELRRAAGGRTQVRFCLRMPLAMPGEKQRAMTAQMERELRTLKQLVEAREAA